MDLVEIYNVSVHHPFRWNKWLRYVTALIRFFTRSHWNHFALLEQYEDGSVAIVEMNNDGINRHKDFWAWAEDKEIRIFSFDIQYDRKVAQTMLDIMVKIKVKYDYRGTTWYGLLYAIGNALNERFGTGVKWLGFTSAGRAAERFYCSEFAAFVWNYLADRFATWYLMTPKALDAYFRQNETCKYHGRAVDLTLVDL